jgi:DNA-binding GntR family transcriptional regulator
MLRLEDRQDSLVARIALDVGLQIIEGDIAPGSDVNSVELAQRFETSRTPVREALMLLEKQDLVEIPARRRPRVAGLDEGPIEEIYRVRAVLTGLAARLLCERATEEDLDNLEVRLEAMRSAVVANDPVGYFWANVYYNDLVTQIAGDSVLGRLLDSLGLRVLQLRHRSMTFPERMRHSLSDHERVFVAYRQRDADLASTMSASIVQDAFRVLTGEYRR